MFSFLASSQRNINYKNVYIRLDLVPFKHHLALGVCRSLYLIFIVNFDEKIILSRVLVIQVFLQLKLSTLNLIRSS